MFKKKFGIIIFMLAATVLFARSRTFSPRLNVMDINLLDGNQFNMYLSNYGKFAQTPDGNSGAWWPANRRLETYIFGAGIWVAAKKNGRKLVSFGYNPNSGQSEMVPAHIRGDSLDYKTALGDPYDRVHIYGKTNPPFGQYDWPLKTVDGRDSVLSIRDGYVVFTDIAPDYQESGSEPIGLYFQMTTLQYTLAGLDRVVFQLYRIQNVSGDTLDSVYVGLCYDDDVGNESGNNANDLVGFIRSFDFPDDTLGPVELNLTYQYQTEPEPGWQGIDGHGMPGVVGSVLLETPLATDTVIIYDTIGTQVIDTVLPGEELGMTAMKIFNINIDPKSDEERYQLMSGYDLAAAGGRYNPYQDDVYGPGDKRYIQVAGPFKMAPGEVVHFYAATLIGKDTVDVAYAARYAISTYKKGFKGPKPPVAPNLYAMAQDRKVVLWWDNLSEVTPDQYAIDEAHNPSSQSYNPAYRTYDFEGYILKRSIDRENWDTLGRWDLRNGVTVLYTDSLILSGDSVIYTDSIYLGTDNGLAHYYVDSNLIDGVTYYYQLEAYDYNYSNYTVDPSTGDTIGTYPFSLKSYSLVEATPHALPVDLQVPTTSVEDHGLYNTVRYEDLRVVNRNAKKATYFLKWIHGGSMPNPYSSLPPDSILNIGFYIEDSATGDVVFDTTFMSLSASYDTRGNIHFTYTPPLPSGILINNDVALEGLKVDFLYDSAMFIVPRDIYSDNVPVIDTIVNEETQDTTYDTTYYNPVDSTVWNITHFPAFRLIPSSSVPKTRTTFIPGNLAYLYATTYRVEWHEDASGDSLTLIVIDTIRGDTIPFDPNVGTTWDQNSARGWGFVVKNGPIQIVDKIAKTSIVPSTARENGVRGFKLPGSQTFFFRDFGHTAQPPAPGTVWYITVPPAFGRMPMNGEYMTIYADSFATTTNYTLDNVTVFPNPYLVMTPRDLSKEFRIGGVHFMHLPRECTIRIYTLSGDLIKTIEVKPEDNGYVTWDLLTNYGTRPASGMYIYHIETPDGKEKTGKIALIF